LIPWLRPADPFPALDSALREPNGLLAAGGDLSVSKLLDAYRHGIFPWFSDEDPILWWSPDPRMVMFPSEIRIPRSLRKASRATKFEVTADRVFARVISACRMPRDGQDGTWITEEMATAYSDLHEAGYAHSLETWIDGELVGGLYGVAIGRAFFGESMFTRVDNASKFALAALAQQLDAWNFGLIDCQMRTDHLAMFGAREIPRTEFAQRLSELVNYDGVSGRWEVEVDTIL
jgi:leucyl/phenylalanyl-tRNA--protein transferase